MTTTNKGPTANLGWGKQGGNPILSCEGRKERGEHRQWHSWSETLGAYQAWAPQQVVRVRSSSTAPLNPLSAGLLFLPLTPRCDEVITQRSPALWPLQKTLRHLSNAHLSAWKTCNLPTNISTPHGKKKKEKLWPIQSRERIIQNPTETSFFLNLKEKPNNMYYYYEERSPERSMAEENVKQSNENRDLKRF